MKFTLKQKIFLTIAFIVSLLPLFAIHYGVKDINELYGWQANLLPIGLPAILIYFVGLWAPLKGDKLGKILSLVGCVGMVLSEVVGFVFTHLPGDGINLKYAFEHATTFFWISLMVSILMVFIYCCVLSLTKNRKKR